jgi:ABC-type multidrug transport system ATPase subunit
MIEMSDVRKSFGTQPVLKGVQIKIDRQTVGLIGANGAGKTTLLKCVLNLLDFEGSIRVAGFDVRANPLEAKRMIGYIPQQFPLWPEMGVAEAMRFVGELRGVGRPRQSQLLEEFDLAGHSHKAVSALSGGMRQKLSIAIALLSDPEVLLLDEPTASLDAWATREILTILESWKGRKSVVLSSHLLDEVRSVAHRLVRLKDGVLTESSVEADAAITREEQVCIR